MEQPETTPQPESPATSRFSEWLGGKPLIPNEQFVIAQANQTLATLVSYEAQYKNDIPKDIQRRILDLADFIHAQLKAMGNESKSPPNDLSSATRRPGASENL